MRSMHGTRVSRDICAESSRLYNCAYMSALTYGTDPEGKAWLRFLSCTREPGTWKEELAAAARAIAQKADRPLWICSSGGLDSEIACRSFYDHSTSPSCRLPMKAVPMHTNCVMRSRGVGIEE